MLQAQASECLQAALTPRTRTQPSQAAAMALAATKTAGGWQLRLQAAQRFAHAMGQAQEEDLVQLLPHRKALESWLTELAGARWLWGHT